MKRKVEKLYTTRSIKKIKRTKSRLKRKIKYYKIKAKKFPMYKSNKRMLKVENLIKNTPPRLHHIHQRRGLLISQ